MTQIAQKSGAPQLLVLGITDAPPAADASVPRIQPQFQFPLKTPILFNRRRAAADLRMDTADGRSISALDAVAAAFKSRVTELQDLILARHMFPAKVMPDLASVDASVTALESQVKAIRNRLQEELDAIPRAKKLVERSMKQQEKLRHMLGNLPSGVHEDVFGTPLVQNALNYVSRSRMSSECFDLDSTVPQVTEHDLKTKEEPVAAPKKGREPAPRLYISAEELDSLSSYMRGRLTIEKVNIAINEVATYADVNAHLVSCPKKKLSEDTWEKALELRDIAATKEVKGKHFFLEADIKGPGLKLDNSGKSILTVLRHLGRIHETRIGHHRVFILLKQT